MKLEMSVETFHKLLMLWFVYMLFEGFIKHYYGYPPLIHGLKFILIFSLYAVFLAFIVPNKRGKLQTLFMHSKAALGELTAKGKLLPLSALLVSFIAVYLTQFGLGPPIDAMTVLAVVVWSLMIAVGFLSFFFFKNFAFLKRIPLAPAIAWLGFVFAIQLVNPLRWSVPGFAMNAIGFLLNVSYMPLFFIAVYTIKTRTDVKKFLILALFMGAIMSSYAFVQFFQGIEGVALYNPSQAEIMEKTVWHVTDQFGAFTAYFKPVSFGSAAGEYSVWASFSLVLSLAFLIISKRPIHRLLFLFTVLMLFVSVVLSGVRIMIVSLVFSLFGFFVFILFQRRSAKFVAVSATMLLLLLFGGFIAVQAIPQIRERVGTLDKPLALFMEARGSQFYPFIPETLAANPAGYGLGLAAGATNFKRIYFSDLDIGPGVDPQFSNTAAEAGIIGLAALIVLLATTLLFFLKRIKQCTRNNTYLFAAIFALSLQIVVGCIAGPAITAPPASYFFFFFLGLAVVISSAKQEARS